MQSVKNKLIYGIINATLVDSDDEANQYGGHTMAKKRLHLLSVKNRAPRHMYEENDGFYAAARPGCELPKVPLEALARPSRRRMRHSRPLE